MSKDRFNQFYANYFPKIFKYVFFRVGGHRELAEDLTSEIFLKVYNAFDTYDESKSHSSWVYTIARNHLANYYRSAGREVTDEDFESLPVAADDLEERFAASEEEATLLKGIAALRPKDAVLIKMKYLDGFSYEEMAGALKREKGALKVATFRAMQELRRVMAPYQSAPAPRRADPDEGGGTV